MIILGIDPGQSGGLAIVDTAIYVEPVFISGMRMPMFQTGTGTRKMVDIDKLNMWLDQSMIRPDLTVIEQVHAMPKQGVVSSFNFGRHAGAVEAWALGLGIPVVLAHPPQWKKEMGLTRSKQDSLDLAALIFGPHPLFEKKADDGIAEAALMALWAGRPKTHSH